MAGFFCQDAKFGGSKNVPMMEHDTSGVVANYSKDGPALQIHSPRAMKEKAIYRRIRWFYGHALKKRTELKVKTEMLVLVFLGTSMRSVVRTKPIGPFQLISCMHEWARRRAQYLGGGLACTAVSLRSCNTFPNTSTAMMSSTECKCDFFVCSHFHYR